MLIKSRRIWLFVWLAVFAVILYGGFTSGWTPLRIVSCVFLALSVALNIAGLYFNRGQVRQMDRMTDQQRVAFLSQFKESERSQMLHRLEAYRKSRTEHVD
jgi:hypothetical protein